MSGSSLAVLAIIGVCLIAVLLGAISLILWRRLSRMEAQKRGSDSRYRTLVEQAGDGIFLVDAQSGMLIEANPSLQRKLGYSAQEIPALHVEDVLIESDTSLDTHTLLMRAYTRSNARTLKERCKDGRLLDVEVTVSTLEIDGKRALCYISHDVTERKNIELELLRNQRRLEHLAHHDSLTGLPNRLRLRAYIEEALASYGVNEGFAVMLLDLDDFKIINDSRGHNIGDELLAEVARQLKRLVGARGMVARLGGDEFVVVLRHVEDRQPVGAFAREIIEAIGGPLPIAGEALSTSVSIGITLCPQDTCDLDAVMSNADLAMYAAKEQGRGKVQFFEPDMNARVHSEARRMRLRDGALVLEEQIQSVG